MKIKRKSGHNLDSNAWIAIIFPDFIFEISKNQRKQGSKNKLKVYVKLKFLVIINHYCTQTEVHGGPCQTFIMTPFCKDG